MAVEMTPERAQKSRGYGSKIDGCPIATLPSSVVIIQGHDISLRLFPGPALSPDKLTVVLHPPTFSLSSPWAGVEELPSLHF